MSSDYIPSDSRQQARAKTRERIIELVQQGLTNSQIVERGYSKYMITALRHKFRRGKLDV